VQRCSLRDIFRGTHGVGTLIPFCSSIADEVETRKSGRPADVWPPPRSRLGVCTPCWRRECVRAVALWFPGRVVSGCRPRRCQRGECWLWQMFRGTVGAGCPVVLMNVVAPLWWDPVTFVDTRSRQCRHCVRKYPSFIDCIDISVRYIWIELFCTASVPSFWCSPETVR